MMHWLNSGRLGSAVIAVVAMFCGNAVVAQNLDTSRLVTLGGGITEIVYALGLGDKLVGTDQSSLYPPEATKLPSVGYYRRLPSEGVVSLRPTLIVASENAGPPEAISQLKKLGIPVVMVEDKPTLESLVKRVEQVSQAVNREEAGKVLIEQFHAGMKEAKAQSIPPLKAMTVVMRGGKLLGAGSETAANVVLQEAGLQNALAGINSYQPLSAEVVSALAPEVIIVTSSTVDSLGGLDKVKQSPVLSMTPAIKNGNVIVLDDLLAQGFGLRFPEAVKQVHDGVLSASK